MRGQRFSTVGLRLSAWLYKLKNWRQALAIFLQQPTKNHLVIAMTRSRLSQILLAQNRLAEAEQEAVTARDEIAQNLGPQHPAMKLVTANLISVYEKDGKHDQAVALK